VKRTAIVVAVFSLVGFSYSTTSGSPADEKALAATEVALEVLAYKVVAPDRSVIETISDTDLAGQLMDLPRSSRPGALCDDASVTANPRACLGVVLRANYLRIASRFAAINDIEYLAQDGELQDLLDSAKNQDQFNDSLRGASLTDIPSDEASGAEHLSRLFSTSPNAWREVLRSARTLSRPFAGSAVWTINGLPFVAGRFLVTGYLRGLPIHVPGGAVDSVTDQDMIVVESFSRRSVVYRAEILFDDDTGSVTEVRMLSPYAISAGHSRGSPIRRLAGFSLFRNDANELFHLGAGADSLPEMTVTVAKPIGRTKSKLEAFAGRFLDGIKRLDEALGSVGVGNSGNSSSRN
jgi:hypothetical protein